MKALVKVGLAIAAGGGAGAGGTYVATRPAKEKPSYMLMTQDPDEGGWMLKRVDVPGDHEFLRIFCDVDEDGNIVAFRLRDLDPEDRFQVGEIRKVGPVEPIPEGEAHGEDY